MSPCNVPHRLGLPSFYGTRLHHQSALADQVAFSSVLLVRLGYPGRGRNVTFTIAELPDARGHSPDEDRRDGRHQFRASEEPFKGISDRGL